MKKITGKALSLVLSIALVASSFSASFASASTKTVSGSVDLHKDDAKVLYLVNGGTNGQLKVDLSKWIDDEQPDAGDKTSMDTPDHAGPSDPKIVDISHSSGDKLVKWGTDDNKAIDPDKHTWLTLKSSTASGKEVISVLYKGTYNDDDGNEIDVKAKADITIYVADKGTVSIGKWYPTLTDRTGKSIEALDDFAQKSDTVKDSQVDTYGTATNAPDHAQFVDSQGMGVYYAMPSNTDAEATYEPLSVALKQGDKNYCAQDEDNADGEFTLKVSGNTSNFYFEHVTGSEQIAAYALDGVKTGGLTFTASYTKTGNAQDINQTLPDGVSTDKVTGKGMVAKLFKVHKWDSVGKDSKTWIYKTGNTALKNLKGPDDKYTSGPNIGLKYGPNATRIDVTGYDLKFVDMTNTTFTIADKISLGKLSGKIGTVNINGGSVGAIKLDNGSVVVGDAKTGDIKTDNSGSVSLSDGTVGNIDASGAVTINSGAAGDVKTSGAISISATDDDKTTTVGAITGVETTLDSENSKLTAKSYTAKDTSAKLILKGSSVSLGKIDFDTRDSSTLSCADFQGKLPTPINATKTAIETTDDDDNVSFTGAASVSEIDLNDSSKVAFDGTVKVKTVTGSGSLKLPLGGLTVTDGVSGSPVLKFSNDFKVGDTAFKANSDAVEADDFDTFGFTLSKSAGSTTDTFKIASTKFAGLVIAPSSARIAKGTKYAQTFKASAYPSGTVIPSGDKIAWDFSGNDVNFKTTANADGTYTVEVIAVDPNFNSENEGKVIAKLQDADANDDSDYDEADCSVTALAVPDATFTSDTGATVTVAQGASYTFKITSVDGKEPTFSVGSNAFSVTKVGKSGNAYFFKITATGAVKTSVGVYVNGVRSTVATIGASTVKIDTTKVTIKTGASYTFKVSGTTVAPSFTSGNTAIAKVASSSTSAGAYFFKVSAVKAGSTGIYVNGVRAAVVTVA